MITLDTSCILASLNRRDSQHTRTVAAFQASSRPYVVPTGILTEVAFMMESRGWRHFLQAFLADIERGCYELDCGDENIPRIRQLMERYSNLPLGFADACVIACAERHGGQVLTLDRDFWIVAREGLIEIAPA
ncbi:MAG TPA: PIN domain-containing protein [Chloroflexota bacterium]